MLVNFKTFTNRLAELKAVPYVDIEFDRCSIVSPEEIRSLIGSNMTITITDVLEKKAIGVIEVGEHDADFWMASNSGSFIVRHLTHDSSADKVGT